MLCHLPFALFTRYFYSLSLCCLICKMGLIPTGVEGKSLNMLMHMQCLVQNDANYYSLHNQSPPIISDSYPFVCYS
jgi:hypothetical protein